MKKSLLVLAASYFAHYPSESKIHFTKDGQAFFDENNATNHGKSLREKESDEVVIDSITREEAEAAAAAEAKAKAAEQKAAAEKAQAEADAKAKADKEAADKEAAEKKAADKAAGDAKKKADAAAKKN